MTGLVVCSFWISRPRDWPEKKWPKIKLFPKMAAILDASCKRWGYEHVVLTDWATAPSIDALGLRTYGAPLPRDMMQATTAAYAYWMESPYSRGVDTLYVGLDCIIRRPVEDMLPDGDVTIAYMKGHKSWRLNNGFIHVRAEARERAAKLLRLVADDTHPVVCDDMAALERALVPLPVDYGTFDRHDMKIGLVPMHTHNRQVNLVDEPAEDACVLHFLGEQRKQLMLDWAVHNGFDA